MSLDVRQNQHMPVMAGELARFTDRRRSPLVPLAAGFAAGVLTTLIALAALAARTGGLGHA